MLTVELKELRRNASPAAQFLRSRLKTTITIIGSQLDIQDAKPREVKLLLNKFLHQKRIRDFRVVAPEPGLLEVREVQRRVNRPSRKGYPPSPAISLPYYFPSSKDVVPFPAGKRPRRKP